MSTTDETVITVHTATADDLDFIHQSNLAMAAETEDTGLDPHTLRNGIAYLLEHPAEGGYMVARSGSDVAGTLMTTFEWSDWRNGRFWWIQSVYVMPQFRRRGVYSAMHDAVRARAAEDPQACGIRLYVERENITAQRTYASLGMYETHYKLYEELFSRPD